MIILVAATNWKMKYRWKNSQLQNVWIKFKMRTICHISTVCLGQWICGPRATHPAPADISLLSPVNPNRFKGPGLASYGKMFSLTGVRHIRKVGRGGVRDIFPFYEDTEVEIQTRECSGDLDGDFTVAVWNIWWANSFNGFILDSSSAVEVSVNNLPFPRGRGSNHPPWAAPWALPFCWSSSRWLEPWALLVATGVPNVWTLTNGSLGELNKAGLFGVILLEYYLK